MPVCGHANRGGLRNPQSRIGSLPSGIPWLSERYTNCTLGVGRRVEWTATYQPIAAPPRHYEQGTARMPKTQQARQVRWFWKIAVRAEERNPPLQTARIVLDALRTVDEGVSPCETDKNASPAVRSIIGRPPSAASVRSGSCFVCGQQAASRHHIVPVRRDGRGISGNLVGLCDSCHKAVHKPWQKFHRHVRKILSALAASLAL